MLAFLLFVSVMTTNGTAIIEHPAYPQERLPHFSCISRFPIVEALPKQGAELIYMDQGRYGAPSREPTVLFTANARWLWNLETVVALRLCCVQKLPRVVFLYSLRLSGS